MRASCSPQTRIFRGNNTCDVLLFVRLLAERDGDKGEGGGGGRESTLVSAWVCLSYSFAVHVSAFPSPLSFFIGYESGFAVNDCLGSTGRRDCLQPVFHNEVWQYSAKDPQPRLVKRNSIPFFVVLKPPTWRRGKKIPSRKPRKIFLALSVLQGSLI